MANPYQQQVFQRKLIYLGIVVALLAAAWGWRRHAVEPKARNLGLLEQSRGDANLLGAAARTGLSGLRGLATCGLWMEAIEQQKKNQWNSLERTVDQLTQLQPHLVTPWLFQSWNLAYNVSVESDRVGDKYFYMTRGIQLLARGERQNRNQPNLRRDIGFYTQHKICQSDETNVLRSLFQLSCIPPIERDPQNFLDEKGNVKLEALREFCQAHPQLARRLHTPPLPHDLRREHRKFRCSTARELVQFLEDNKNVPSMYVSRQENQRLWEEKKPRDNPLDRFPVLPPRVEEYPDGTRESRSMADRDDLTAETLAEKPVPDEVDGFMIAKAWYGYSLECIPAPGKRPGEIVPPTDPSRQRRPKHMSVVIFRSSAPRAQTYVADRLQVEGWFDREPFELTEWFKASPSAVDIPPKVGEPRDWSADAWRKADQLWRQFGTENKLLFDDNEMAALRDKAAACKKKFRPDQPGNVRPDPAQLDDVDRANLEAFEFLMEFENYRRITNLTHYLTTSIVEAQERTIKARKLMYLADQRRVVSQALNRALELYEHPDSLFGWRQLMEEKDNAAFRADTSTQEATLDTELKYHRLYRRLNEDKLAPDLALLATFGQAVAGPPLGADWTLSPLFSRPLLQPEIQVLGPFDYDTRGNSLFSESAKQTVMERRGLLESKPPPNAAGGPSGLGGPPSGPPSGPPKTN